LLCFALFCFVLLLLLLLLSAFQRQQTTATSPDPQGGAHGCAPFSDRAMDGESENPRDTDVVPFALSRKRLSLVTFFGKTKKVTRLQAEAFASAVCRGAEQNHTSERLRSGQATPIPTAAGTTPTTPRP
jgi:hypothetical protein